MRIRNDGFDNEYINGYEKNQSGIAGLSSMVGGWKDKWENIGEKVVAEKEKNPVGKMYTDADNQFKYGKLGEWNNFSSGDYEDPTYLGFNLMFDDLNSPLWDYGGFDGENVKKHNQTPGYFIEKYNRIGEIANRDAIYIEFLKNLNKIFARFTDTDKNKYKKIHYIESIAGLDKLSDKMVKYPENKITIQLTEDISLRTSYLAELYNNLIYSYKNQKNLIPENLLRFDLVIDITDIRVFRKIGPKMDITVEKIDPIIEEVGFVSVTNTDPARIVYTLHDCNFDFTKSVPFDALMRQAGLNMKMSTNPTVTEFEIKYKSVSKEFRSPLLKNSLRLSNKIYNVASGYDDSNPSNIIDKYQFFKYRIKHGSETTLSPVESDPSLSKKLGVLAAPYLSEAKGQLMNKFHEMRGELINKTLEDLRNNITFLPKIYPDNVYSTDFRKLSIKNFAKGIGSHLANDALKGATDGINGVLGF